MVTRSELGQGCTPSLNCNHLLLACPENVRSGNRRAKTHAYEMIAKVAQEYPRTNYSATSLTAGNANVTPSTPSTLVSNKFEGFESILEGKIASRSMFMHR